MARQFTILVVDDDEAVREVTGEVLASAGYRTLTASDGYEALRLLSMERVDLLFTDIRMPNMDGYDLALRASEAQPNLRLLFTSGFAGNVPAANRPDAGTISKPWRAHQLISEVTHLLGTHH